MKHTNNPTVSITKIEKSTEKAVKKAINFLGGMASFVSEGDEIYLKPNFVAPRDSTCGATTDFEIIRVVAEEVRLCGGIPILFEMPAIDFEKEKVYDYLGVRTFAKKHQIRFVDGIGKVVRLPISDGLVLKSIKVPDFLLNAKIINMPKLKTHIATKMTCGMKNLMGLLPNSEKRKFHILGVHKSIVDLASLFNPILTLVDATTCMEGDGPAYGDKTDVGLIVAGKDMIAVDKICSQIIGLPWQHVEYIRLSIDKFSTEGIKVVGESIEDVENRFKIPRKSFTFYLFFRLIYAFDVLFSLFSSIHFNHFLYSTGFIGTNPKIIKSKCNKCGSCVDVCPVDNVLDIDAYSIDYTNCIRCLDCYPVCDQHAIIVKGISRPNDL